MSLLVPVILGSPSVKESAVISLNIQFYIVNPLIIAAFFIVYLYQKRHLRFLEEVLSKEQQSELAED